MRGMVDHYDAKRFAEEPGLRQFRRDYVEGEFWPWCPEPRRALTVLVARVGRAIRRALLVNGAAVWLDGGARG
jgi:hypothetical protein